MESSPAKLFFTTTAHPASPPARCRHLFRRRSIWLASLALLILGSLPPAAQAQLPPGTILMTDNPINSLFAVDAVTGNRVRISGGLAGNPGFPLIGSGITFIAPGDPALLPSGQVIVGDSTQDRLIEVDPATGDRTTFSGPGVGLGPSLQFPSRFAFNPVSGTIYVTDPVVDTIFAVDPVTRDRSIVSDSVVGSGPPFDRPSGVALADLNTLIVCDLNLKALFEVNIATGARTIISGDPNGVNIGTGPLPVSSHLVTLGGDVIMNAADDEVIIRVDRTTGNRTIISGPGVGTGQALILPNGGITVADSSSVYVGEQGLTGILRVDLATGDRTVVMSAAVGMGATFISPSAIYAIPMVDNTVFADGFETGDTSAWSAVTP